MVKRPLVLYNVSIPYWIRWYSQNVVCMCASQRSFHCRIYGWAKGTYVKHVMCLMEYGQIYMFWTKKINFKTSYFWVSEYFMRNSNRISNWTLCTEQKHIERNRERIERNNLKWRTFSQFKEIELVSKIHFKWMSEWEIKIKM